MVGKTSTGNVSQLYVCIHVLLFREEQSYIFEELWIFLCHLMIVSVNSRDSYFFIPLQISLPFIKSCDIAQDTWVMDPWIRRCMR